MYVCGRLHVCVFVYELNIFKILTPGMIYLFIETTAEKAG